MPETTRLRRWRHCSARLRTTSLLFLIPLLLVAAWAPAADRPDRTLADFEGETYGEWQVEGEAFGPGPARGTLPGQMAVSGYHGDRLVNSFYRGDGTTGRLLSPLFRIERRYLNFLVGGGAHPGKTCVNLLLEGEVVRSAAGRESERLDWHTWDVEELAGKTVRIEIVDRETGGWGHINVDQIVQSDRKQAAVLRDQSRMLRFERRYLNLPVKTGAPKRRMAVLLDGRPVREFEIELADADPDFWVFMDVSAFRGRDALLRVAQLPESSQGLQAVVQSDSLVEAEDLYREKYRPQFHFTARRGWLNDPNGLVFSGGEYHLFYQHNPYGWSWGNMHWGHAVSRDLVHWQELPIALYPPRFGDWAFSGSAAVDRENSSGFGDGKGEVIVAAFTSTGRGECIAYSRDRGRTFTEYAGNPVLKHDGRDPKIFWYAPGRHWVMAVFSLREGQNGILFLTSPDLKQWERQSWIEGYYECPELFELPVDGDPRNRRWVLYGADGSYALGRFNGKEFTPESGKHPANWGNCFYASQTYNDLPESDGRRIRVGWGTVAIPGMPFNQMMNFPVELTLRTTDEGIRLFAQPVRELRKLHRKRHPVAAGPLSPGTNPLAGLSGELWDLRADLEPGAAAEVRLEVRGNPIFYDARRRVLTCQGKSAPLAPVEGRIRLQLLVDRTSIEIFGNDGRIYMPIGVIPPEADRSLALSSAGGEARIRALEVYELRSIW